MKNIEALYKWPYVKGIQQWPADPPNKAPVILKVFSISWHNHDMAVFYLSKNSNLTVSFFISSQFVCFQINMPFLNLHITSLIKLLPEIMLPHTLALNNTSVGPTDH